MSQKINLWWNKSRRAQNNEDYETWVQGGVVPTMNAFDNGDTRATTIIFYGNRVADIRLQDDKINTLQARMGTGGNNMPMVAHPIQGNMIGRSDTAGPSGKGYGDTDEPMFSLTSTDRHAIAGSMLVRRLTPLECERLQGFPDGWTEDQVDTHRYKQMGNAVAVPVVEWIIQGIIDLS
jgi:site-specific DNA-cytosine methylase